MIAQTLDLLDRFLPDVYLERNVAGNHVAAEREFLPDHNSQLIADIVEIVGFVVAAAPFANHVHVRVASGLKDLAMNLRCDSVGKAVEGNDIGTFRVHGDAVYHELETLSPLIGGTVQLHRT